MTVPAIADHSDVIVNEQFMSNAFLNTYCSFFRKFPERAYTFYGEMSVLSRTNSDGTMTSVTTLKGVDAYLQSLNFGKFMPEIETVVIQKSYHWGIMVVVTGSMGWNR